MLRDSLQTVGTQFACLTLSASILDVLLLSSACVCGSSGRSQRVSRFFLCWCQWLKHGVSCVQEGCTQRGIHLLGLRMPCHARILLLACIPSLVELGRLKLTMWPARCLVFSADESCFSVACQCNPPGQSACDPTHSTFPQLAALLAFCLRSAILRCCQFEHIHGLVRSSSTGPFPWWNLIHTPKMRLRPDTPPARCDGNFFSSKQFQPVRFAAMIFFDLFLCHGDSSLALMFAFLRWSGGARPLMSHGGAAGALCAVCLVLLRITCCRGGLCARLHG